MEGNYNKESDVLQSIIWFLSTEVPWITTFGIS